MLRIEDVTKTFGGLKALDSVNLVCGAGKATGLIGPNGSGKTTLFNLITGVLSRDSGRITLDELDLPIGRPDEVARRGLIRTYQIPRLATQMTVLENLMAVPRNTHEDGLLAALLRSRSYQRSEAEVLDRAGVQVHDHHLRLLGLGQMRDQLLGIRIRRRRGDALAAQELAEFVAVVLVGVDDDAGQLDEHGRVALSGVV